MMFRYSSSSDPLFAVVVSGAFREYCIDEAGREHNVSLVFSGDWWLPSHGIAGAEGFTQAMRPSEIVVVQAEHGCTHPPLNDLMVELTQASLSRQRQRYVELLTLSPLDRYHLLLAQVPDIERTVPQYQIASYLGITPVSLSRLRKRKRWSSTRPPSEAACL